MSNQTNTIALVNSFTTLPNGTYEGLWSGYRIRILDRTEIFENGVRSLDGVAVIVNMTDGVAIASE